jgi:hypothetical protein
MIHVALVSAYPSEAEARAAVGTDLTHLAATGTDVPYRGIWSLPSYERTLVHVFTADTADELLAAGWTRRERT